MHDYIYKRKARNRADLIAAGPLLERAVEHRRLREGEGLEQAADGVAGRGEGDQSRGDRRISLG